MSLWCRVSGIPYPKITWFRKFANDDNTPKEGIEMSNTFKKVFLHLVLVFFKLQSNVVLSKPCIKQAPVLSKHFRVTLVG